MTKKTCLSYMSFGLLSVFFQKFDWELNTNQVHYENNRKRFSEHTIKLNEIKSYQSLFYRNQEESLQKRFFTAPRLYKSPVEYYSKDIETNPNKHRLEILYIKYKNFVFSPKVYFVFETVIYNYIQLRN